MLLIGLISATALATSSIAFAQTIEDENRLAAGYYSREQWEEAAAAFERLIARYPNTTEASEAHFFVGEAYMQQSKFQPAYTAFQIFLQRHPDHLFAPRATFRMGEAAYQIGNLAQGIRLLEIYIKQNPTDKLNEFALPYLGLMRLQRSEPQLAIRAFETGLKTYPQGQLANKSRFGMAQAFQLLGANADAKRFYQFIADQSANPLQTEAQLQLALIHLNESEFETAEQLLREVLPKCSTAPAICEATYWLARIHADRGDFGTAFSLLKTVVGKAAPNHLSSAIYFDGAIAATKVNETKSAKKWLTQLLEQFPNSQLADKAAHLRIQLAREDEIQTLVQQFLNDYPNSPLRSSVRETSARAMLNKQQFAKSIEAFDQLLAEDKHLDATLAGRERANWQYLKSLGQMGLGQFVAAEETLSHLDGIEVSNELKPLSQLALATARFGQQKFQHAIPNYREYLNHESNTLTLASSDQLKSNPAEKLRARTELTVCLAESGLWQEVDIAFKDLTDHHATADVTANTLQYLANKAARSQQNARAIKWFEQLISNSKQAETKVTALSRLGWLKYETGDTRGAQAAFNQLISEFPDHELTAAAAMAQAKFSDDNQQHVEAAKLYGLVLRRFPESESATIARLRRAHALQKTGDINDLVEAKTLLQEYLALPGDIPSKDEALYQLGWVNFDLKANTQGLKNFQQLLTEYPTSKYCPDAAFRLAQDAIQRDDLLRGAELLKPLISSNAIAATSVPAPIALRALYLTGEIAAKQNRWEVVTQSMEQFLTQSDDAKLNLKARYWLAESNYRQQKFSDASEQFRELKNEHANLERPLQPWIFLRLAQSLGKQNEWSEALQVAETGKAQFADFAADYEFDFVRGRGLEDAGRLSDARTAYQLVLKSKRGGATETAAIAQWRIGETFFHQEKYAEAIQAYYSVDSLFSFEKWRGAAMLQAGKCQEHLNNWKHAEKLYSRLVAELPSCEHAAAAKQRLERVQSLAKLERDKQTGTR